MSEAKRFVTRQTVTEWLDALDIEVTSKQLDGLFHFAESAAPVKLYDSQWVNIVNHANCWAEYSKEDAVHEAVKMTEQAIKANAIPVASSGAGSVPEHLLGRLAFHAMDTKNTALSRSTIHEVLDCLKAAPSTLHGADVAPIYQEERDHQDGIWQDVKQEHFETLLSTVRRIVYLAPPSAPAEESAEPVQQCEQALVLKALNSAKAFIRNGVEFGYVRMPDSDCPDPALQTPVLIERAIAALNVAKAPGESNG